MLSIFSFIVALVILCVSIVVSYLYKNSQNLYYWKKRNISGPKAKLYSGTFPKATAGICNLIEELHEIYLKYKTTDKFVGVFNGYNPKLFIVDPKVAKFILTQNFRNFHDNESSKWTSSEVEQLRLCSPFVSVGETWKEKRSELVPALTANRIRGFYDIMRNKAKNLTRFIEQNSKTSLDVKKLANYFTAEFMVNFIWGIEENVFFATEATHTPTVYEMANSMISQALACVRYYGRTNAWPCLRKFYTVRFFPLAVDAFFKQLARQAFKIRLDNTVAERCDVIDHLAQLMKKKSLNDIQIAGHTTTVLIDGFETGAIVIAHCLLLLARNEDAQQKLHRELKAAGESVSFDELNELPYLEQCLQESLRIFPPLPGLFKLCTEEFTLETLDADASDNINSKQLTLKPNDVIYISAYSFHHDPDYYKSPEEFRPERFDESLGGIRKYRDMNVFLPFGDGPRMCPGMKLGLAEAKVAVAEIVRNFRMKPSARMRTDNKIAPNSFLLTIDGGIDLIFEKL